MNSIIDLSEEERTKYFRDLDLTKTPFKIKVADFKLSKQLMKINSKLQQFCGALVYMSPQMLMKSKYTYKHDIWSIGIILYTLLTQKNPFKHG